MQDNIFLPLVLSGKPYPEMERRLDPLAKLLGITELLGKYPYEISGGQKQRAAVARALITQPRSGAGRRAHRRPGLQGGRPAAAAVLRYQRQGQTILMVTHSTQAASHAGRVLFIKDGEVFHQLYRGGMTNDELYQKIADTLTVLATGGGEVG